MVQIEVNYRNPQKPRGVVGGRPTVPLNEQFSFFSHDGTLQVQFLDDSPVSGDAPPKRLQDNTQFVASKPGRFRFQCFIDGELIPTEGGGEIEIPPAM